MTSGQYIGKIFPYTTDAQYQTTDIQYCSLVSSETSDKSRPVKKLFLTRFYRYLILKLYNPYKGLIKDKERWNKILRPEVLPFKDSLNKEIEKVWEKHQDYKKESVQDFMDILDNQFKQWEKGEDKKK